jgi:hypothetical protein
MFTIGGDAMQCHESCAAHENRIVPDGIDERWLIAEREGPACKLQREGAQRRVIFSASNRHPALPWVN